MASEEVMPFGLFTAVTVDQDWHSELVGVKRVTDETLEGFLDVGIGHFGRLVGVAGYGFLAAEVEGFEIGGGGPVLLDERDVLGLVGRLGRDGGDGPGDFEGGEEGAGEIHGGDMQPAVTTRTKKLGVRRDAESLCGLARIERVVIRVFRGRVTSPENFGPTSSY